MNLSKITVLLGASLMLLTGCQSKNDPNDAKKKLEEKGYIVNVLIPEEYQKTETVKSIPATDGLEYYLNAGKIETSDFLFAWYFDSFESASSFFDAHTRDFFEMMQVFENKGAYGTVNNTVYVGTETASKDSGLNTL